MQCEVIKEMSWMLPFLVELHTENESDGDILNEVNHFCTPLQEDSEIHQLLYPVAARTVFHSNFNDFPAVEGVVFVVGDVAELVAEAVGGADGLVDVAVGVAVYPVVDSAGGDVPGGIGGECAVDAAAQELWGDLIEISS